MARKRRTQLKHISRILQAQKDGRATRLVALHAVDMVIGGEQGGEYVYDIVDSIDEKAGDLFAETRRR